MPKKKRVNVLQENLNNLQLKKAFYIFCQLAVRCFFFCFFYERTPELCEENKSSFKNVIYKLYICPSLYGSHVLRLKKTYL